MASSTSGLPPQQDVIDAISAVRTDTDAIALNHAWMQAHPWRLLGCLRRYRDNYRLLLASEQKLLDAVLKIAQERH
jgi:hypothetical protein